MALPINPSAGNLVACSAMYYSGGATGTTIVTAKDANNNNYTVTPNSPSTYLNSAGQTFMLYLLKTPATADKTITVTFADTITWAGLWCDEFSVAGGNAVFDKDAKATTLNSTGTISSPTITPSSTKELFYGACQDSSSITGVILPWSEAAGGSNSGNLVEYNVSVSSPLAVKFSNSTTDDASCTAMAFRFVVASKPVIQ